VRKLILMAATALAMSASDSTGAQSNRPWCADDHSGGTNCSFFTLEQCLESARGVGASCQPNPRWYGERGQRQSGYESPAARRGLRFVQLHCAQCHAIDRHSQSPVPTAPPFRSMHIRYPVADLQQPLAAGVFPSMPIFRLEPGQVADIMDYLRTLEP
jgi:cytochrome c